MPTFEIEGRRAPGGAEEALRGVTKRSVELPEGLSPDQQARILQQIINTGIPEPAQREQAVELQRGAREQSIEGQLGAPLIRDERGVPGELDKPGLRFDLARSNLLSEKSAKIQSSIPDAEVREFTDPNTGPSLAIRLPGEAGFVLLDSDQAITVSDAMDALGSVANLETLTTIIASVASQGAGLIARLGAQFVGGTVGRSLDIGVESARGFEQDPVQSLVADATSSGLLAGAGEMAFAPFRRAVRGVTQGEDTAAREAVQQFTEATGRPPTPGLTSPGIRRAENQAVATSRAAEAQRISDLAMLRKDFQDRVDKANFNSLSDDELNKFVNDVTADSIALIDLQRPLSPEAAGNALRRGRKTFRKVAGEEISRRYNKAFELGEDAVFDMRVVKERAGKILEGIRARGSEPGETVQLRKIKGELRERLEAITKLDDQITTIEDANAFEQIKELRTSFFDLKNATIDGKATNDNRLAGEIWDILSNSMDNPTGGSPEFRLAFRRASSANRLFERIIDITDLATIARSNVDRPGVLIDTLVQPGNAKTLRTLKRILPENEFQRFKDGITTKFLAEPEKVNGFLNRFRADPEALATIYSDREVELFRTFGEQIRRLNSGPIVKALNEQTSLAERAKNLATSSDVSAVKEFIKRSGGKDSNRGRALRGGFIQGLIDSATDVKKGLEVIDPQKMVGLIKKFEENGAIDAIMTPQEAAFLKNRQAMLSFFDFSADAGASIRASELVGGAAEILTVPVHPAGAFKSFIRGTTGLARNALIGRVFMSPAGRRLFAGIGKGRQPDLTTLRAVAAITAETLKDFREQNDKPAKNPF